jgi:hypothetical protein
VRRVWKFSSPRGVFPPRKHTALSNERGELRNVLSDFSHKPVRTTLILETFVHVIQKAATKERMMEKFVAGTGRDFERVLNGVDSFKIQCF